MSKLIPLNKLFKPIYGVNLELVNVDECSKQDANSIRFVSRTESNNGVSAYVRIIEDIVPNPSHTISVATSGSVLSSFYQEAEYYSGRDLYYLIPKKKMSKEEMMFYAFCIKANKYKYNYGRAANRTLKDILLPSKMPNSFKKITFNSISIPSDKKVIQKELELHSKNWKPFKYSDLFRIERGRGVRLKDLDGNGLIPFVTSTDKTNGWNGFTDHKPMHKDNVISVTRNGSVGEAFYQPTDFCSTEDVQILNPLFSLNPYIAMFLITLIRLEKYRYNYGRKWGLGRMNDTYIKLPIDKKGDPDWVYMENYIKSLPYSTSI